MIPQAKEPLVLNLKCRNPRGCDSNEATEISLQTPEHQGHRLYRCLKCSHTWGVTMGGHLAI